MNAKYAPTLAAILALASACGQPRDLSLLANQEDQSYSAESAARRQRMYITMTQVDAADVASPLEWNAGQVARDVVLESCFLTLRAKPGEPFTNTAFETQCTASAMVFGVNPNSDDPAPTPVFKGFGNECEIVVCRVQAALCASNLLLELASAVDVTTLSAGSGDHSATYTIAPQDEESAVALSEEAFHYAAWAATAAGETLRSAAIGATGAICADNELTDIPENATYATRIAGVPYGQALAASLADGAIIAEEAAEAAARHHKTVAEADFARTRDVKVAAKLAWADPYMSLARAAHNLVGGGLASGFPLVPEGMCPMAALSEGGERAVNILRLAAPHPNVVANVAGIPLERLFTDIYQNQTDSLRQRLAERTGDSSIEAESLPDFLEGHGLTETDFLEARTYLAQEVKAFSRDTTKVIAALPVASTQAADGGLIAQHTTHTIWAATASPPTPPPAMHYLAQARSGAPATVAEVDSDCAAMPCSEAANGLAPSPDKYALSGLMQLQDYETTVASHILGAGADKFDAQTQSTLGVIASGGGAWNGHQQIVRRLESCFRYYEGKDEMRFRIYGTSDASRFKIVREASGLACATTGKVEGATCVLSAYINAATASDTEPLPDGRLGFRDYVELTTEVQDEVSWLYVVEAVDGTAQGPGDYRAIGGLRVVADKEYSADYRYCVLQPSRKDIEEEVGKLLTPSTERCGRPAESCTGIDVGDVISLETELSDDGTQYESSWRTHLARASAAAERADQLGEQLIEAGLQMDYRIEEAEEALESLCGAPVSLDDYLPSGDSDDYYDGACIEGGDGTNGDCEVGYICRNGACVRDLMSEVGSASGDASAMRLNECLGEDAVVPYVAIGETQLCMWRHKTTLALCSPYGDHPCPFPLDGPCALPDPAMGTTYEAVPVTETLGLFTNPDRPPDELEAFPCEGFRALRVRQDGEITDEDVRRAIGSFYSVATLQDYASRIGWDGRPLDTGAVTVDGRDFYSTGDPATGNSSEWPCASYVSARAECPRVATTAEAPGFNRTPLFCGYSQDCDRTDRARWNQRLGRAVLALRILTGVGVDGLTLPGDTAPLNDARDVEFFVTDLSAERRLNTRRASQDDNQIMDVCIGWDDVAWTHFGDPNNYDQAIGEPALCANNERIRFVKPGPKLPDDGAVSEKMLEIWDGIDGEALWTRDDPCYGLALRVLTNPAMGMNERLVGRRSESWPGFEEDDCGPSCCDTAGLTEFDFGYSWIAPNGITVRDLLDAMELVCQVAADLAAGDGLETQCVMPTGSPDALGDLAESERYLKCVANQILRQANRAVLTDVPMLAVDAIKGTYDTSALEVHGERGAAVAELMSALRLLSEQEVRISHELAAYASEMALLRLTLRDNQIAGKLEAVELQAKMANVGAGALLSALGGNLGFLSAAQTMGEVYATVETYELNSQRLEIRGEMSWEEFKAEFRGHEEALVDAAGEIEKQTLVLRGALARLAVQRARGQRELANAAFVGSDGAEGQYSVNTVMRRRYNTLRVRYEEARRDAVRLAALARMAVEQRLGVGLATITDDMTLVDAPARWADELCMNAGIDYRRIREETGLEVDNYAGEYVGDYVRKLEMVMDSYELDFPFADSEDTAVISLRDDIGAAGRMCEGPVPNLLAHSSVLDGPDWGCVNPGEAVGPDGGAITNCLSATRVAESPFGVVTDETGDVGAFMVTFGPGEHESFYSPPDGGGGVANPTSALAQVVYLDAGYYRVSWYGKRPANSPLWPGQAVVVRTAGDGVSTAGGFTIPTSTTVEPGTFVETEWTRYHFLFQISEPGAYQIAIVPSPAGENRSVLVAGVMLEDVGWEIGPVSIAEPGLAAALVPGPYVATDEAGRGRTLCEGDPGAFRAERWRRGCTRLCDTGFGQCADGEVHCYWELRFSITTNGIESGDLLRNSGFAYGNYNVRHDWVALNLVGTGVRNCENSNFPEACYASGNVPFTLRHAGPFTVRNHWGGEYDAPLANGVIEHARALAAERYVTNPMSSSDRGLVEPYAHSELRGRPLGGGYVLRLWDEDGFNFSALEDVQVILGYRYWTRFELPSTAEN